MYELDGIWVARDGGRYQELLISAAGDGWYESGRSHCRDISEFTWCRSAPNRIDLEYGETREVEEDGSVKRGDWEGERSSHTYELVGDGSDRPVALRFDPPLGGTTEFVRRVGDHPYPRP